MHVYIKQIYNRGLLLDTDSRTVDALDYNIEKTVGLDIPKCSLVIGYAPDMNTNACVYAKGGVSGSVYIVANIMSFSKIFYGAIKTYIGRKRKMSFRFLSLHLVSLQCITS